MAPFSIKLFFDVSSAAFGATLKVPSSLQELLENLPDGAKSLTEWMPDIVLDDVGLAFDPGTRSFGLFADAGIAGSADPSAQAFLSLLPTPDAGGFGVVVGLGLTTPIDLGRVPVLGSLLSGISLEDLAVVFASADFPKGKVVLPPPAPREEPAFRKGLSLALTIGAGDARQSFSLSPAGPKPPPGPNRSSVADPAPGPPVQWFDVQKKIGPIMLGRIGIATAGDWLGFGLDASLTLTGLAVNLVGFTAGFPKDDISIGGLDLALDGLSVFFEQGSVTILGSLVRANVDGITQYNGALLIQAGKYGIAAVGSFAEIEGAISMFVFGSVQGVFGGPPAFLVTGIAAGFGYNRGLVLPKSDQVLEFPLVLIATLGDRYVPDPGNLAVVLGKLTQGGWVPPQLGSYWVAAGVQFSTFEILSSFAMLSVQFGRELVIALLGTSTLQLPKGVSAKPYVLAQMTLDAVLRPAEGTFKMTALLTPSSFVMDPNCRLTGGFAFFLWFGDNEHSGDFVVSLGGYNPYFRAPDWYPKLPRLGFVWNISSELHAEGGAYFALTPSAVMAGGALAIKFQSGDLKAWFTAHADFVMWWKPFYFIVDIGVSIGASYTLNLGLVHKTFSVELSANVKLWGPSIAGTARVKWWVISFSIDINGGGSPNPPGNVLADWNAFAETYLPSAGATRARLAGRRSGALADDNTEVVRPLVTSGMLGQFTDGADIVWLVAAADVRIASETVIPATKLVIAGPSDGATRVFDGPATGVYPLGTVALGSTHQLSLVRSGDGPVDLSAWSWTPTATNAPESLWGRENDGTKPVAANVLPALMGSQGAPAPPAISGPPPAPLAWLAFDDLPHRTLPLPDRAPIDGGTAKPTVDSRNVIASTIMRPDTIDARDAVVAVLVAAGVGDALVGGDLSLLSKRVNLTFQAPPMLGPLGSTGPKQTSSSRVREPMSAMRSPTAPPAAPATPKVRVRSLHHRRSGGGRGFQWIESIVADSFLRSGDRARLAATTSSDGGARATLAPGAMLVLEVAPVAGHVVESDGALPLRLVALDREDRVLLDDWVSGSRTLPDTARRIVITCSDARSMGRGLGWTEASQFVLVSPRALVGEGLVLRAQSPMRLAHGRSTRALGSMTGRALARENAVLGARGRQAGWIEATLPATSARTISVTLAADPSSDSDSVDATRALVARSGPGTSGHLGPTRLRHITHGDRTASLRFELPFTPLMPWRVLVEPSFGWRCEGLSVGEDGRPSPKPTAGANGTSDRECLVVRDAVRDAVRSGRWVTTEVTIR